MRGVRGKGTEGRGGDTGHDVYECAGYVEEFLDLWDG